MILRPLVHKMFDVHYKKFAITVTLCQYSSNPLCGSVGIQLMAGNHAHIWQQHFLPTNFQLSLAFYYHLSFTDSREITSLCHLTMLMAVYSRCIVSLCFYTLISKKKMTGQKSHVRFKWSSQGPFHPLSYIGI